MSQADQLPFLLHLLKASQEEIAKSEALFDLAEHRFDNHLSTSVLCSPLFCSVSTRHLLFRGQVTWGRIRHFVVVLLTTGRDEYVLDAFIRIQSVHVLFAEVTRVAAERSNAFCDAGAASGWAII